MKPAAKKIYKVIRTILVTTIITAVVLYGLAYILLSIPAIQNKIKAYGEKELSEYLKTDVTIGDISIKPFNQLILYDVKIPDQQGGKMIDVEKIGAGVSIYNLILKRKLVLTYAEVIGLNGHVTRPDPQSPMNIQFLIDALSPKDNKPKKPTDVTIHNIVIRKSALTYDVLSEPELAGRFDMNHVKVSDLRADVDFEKLKNHPLDLSLDVKRLSFKEKSGLNLKNISCHFDMDEKQMRVKDLNVEFPGTKISPSHEIVLNYNSPKTIATDLMGQTHHLELRDNYITLSDFKGFAPQLKDFTKPLRLTAQVSGNTDEVHIGNFHLASDDKSTEIDIKADVYNLSNLNALSFQVPAYDLKTSPGKLMDLLGENVLNVSPIVKSIIRNCKSLHLKGNVKGTPDDIQSKSDISTPLGNVTIDGAFRKNAAGEMKFDGHVETPRLNVGGLIDKLDIFGEVGMNTDVSVSLLKNQLQSAQLKGNIAFVDFKGTRYHNINADFTGKKNEFHGLLSMNDPDGEIELNGDAVLNGKDTKIDVDLYANRLALSKFKSLSPGLPDNTLSLKMNASFTGNDINNATGVIDISDLTIAKSKGAPIHLNHIELMAQSDSRPKLISITSDFVNGRIEGQYDFKTIVPAVKGMLAQAFPDMFGKYASYTGRQSDNNFTFHFVVDPNEKFNALVQTPVKLVYKATVTGNLNAVDKDFNLNVSAPYLLQGKNLIEGTMLTASINKAENVTLNAHTLLPSKNGKITVALDANGVNDRLDSDLSWKYDRERDYHGNIRLSTLLKRGLDNALLANVEVEPSEIVANDTVWNVESGNIFVMNSEVLVDSIVAHRDNQLIGIDGKVSKNPDDVLTLTLQDIDLDYVFETLHINHVSFGGRATGVFYASNLLSKTPRLSTPGLNVSNLKYNNAVMGDAIIESHWDVDKQAVAINADLSQDNGHHSLINGEIFPGQDSLYFDFKANRANVAFMKPFVSAFSSDISGEATGQAVLLGNFHNIDLYGDIKADDLTFKIDYTNVDYTCHGDSVHMIPGRIAFNDVTIYDRDNHKAKLNGWITHRYFHDPSFNFSITDAHDLLAYDISEKANPDWYGTIYGNGSAFVTGEPGVVNIKVAMESAPRSKFTFVMSDAEVANEYNFITYRDRDQLNIPPVVMVEPEDTLPEIVRQLKQQINKTSTSLPTKYKIDLQGDITPDLQMILVMDPVGGDRIKATGRGNLKMTYDNDDEQLGMFGKYVLDKGSYNFTLQDIIIKDFTIRDGSSISFQGDPYKALLDIEAIYSLNANIRDLDQSFASDRDLNRTNVPVHALLRVQGAISAPDISFDLEFPTLTSEAHRKVKSVISTEEMMNRQIIYLLALNRFYTPEYMNNSTNNNELVSVASSTISSQLSSMLGQISENWSISPNFRSDKGDFSDMEVDVMLSSQLLNNRLLFNGNFGYRDNTYNTKNSNFIGDFDIEYLLNPKGSLRLKAYNHFNDQNYYVRNAMTTQGVGIVFKHDFDRWFDFMKKKEQPAAVATDTVPGVQEVLPVQETDTVAGDTN